MRFQITSTALEASGTVETAADVAAKIGRSAEWIIERTGVAKRYVSNLPVEVMGANAARAALGGGPPPDLLINASTTPRQIIPDTSVFIARALGLKGVPAFSIHSTCLSFLVALNNAGALIVSGQYKRILIVSAEIGSLARNFAEPESAALLGDCAAAAIIEPTPEGSNSRLLAWKMATWPDGAELAELRGGGTYRYALDPATNPDDHLFHMDGPAIYKMALRRGAQVVSEVLEMAKLKVSDVDLVVPHQASGPGVRALERFGFPADRVVNIVAAYGNCIAASIPAALAVANAAGRLHRGDMVLLVGTGAGLSVAAALLEW